MEALKSMTLNNRWSSGGPAEEHLSGWKFRMALAEVCNSFLHSRVQQAQVFCTAHFTEELPPNSSSESSPLKMEHVACRCRRNRNDVPLRGDRAILARGAQ